MAIAKVSVSVDADLLAEARELAGRLEGPDRDAVAIAADLLEEAAGYFRKSGHLK